jgi:hypothetical protein
MSESPSPRSITRSANDPASSSHQAVNRSSFASRSLVGAFLGLAWGASLRAWMVLLALELGDRPEFSWTGTFAAVLFPAALCGAILGGAVYVAETSAGKRWRWAILSPLLLPLGPAIATDGFINILITTGMGGGAIGVALIGITGGYAFSGFGPKWTRWISGLLALFFAIASVIPFYIAGPSAPFPPNVSAAFSMLLFVILMVLLVAGVSAPSRFASGQHNSP